MGQQIIRQPNGLYALWSTIVDCFILLDATPEDIIQDWMERDERNNRRRAMEVVAKLKKGEKRYYQFTLTWKQCLKTIREYGEHLDILEKVKNLKSKEEAKKRLKYDTKHRGHDLWLHLPSGRAIPEKPENARDEDWRRIVVWLDVETLQEEKE